MHPNSLDRVLNRRTALQKICQEAPKPEHWTMQFHKRSVLLLNNGVGTEQEPVISHLPPSYRARPSSCSTFFLEYFFQQMRHANSLSSRKEMPERDKQTATSLLFLYKGLHALSRHSLGRQVRIELWEPGRGMTAIAGSCSWLMGG